jgi:hypothetical protein
MIETVSNTSNFYNPTVNPEFLMASRTPVQNPKLRIALALGHFINNLIDQVKTAQVTSVGAADTLHTMVESSVENSFPEDRDEDREKYRKAVFAVLAYCIQSCIIQDSGRGLAARAISGSLITKYQW